MANTSVKFLGNETLIAAKDEMMKIMRDHAVGLMVVGDHIYDFHFEALEGRILSMRYDIYSPYFLGTHAIHIHHDIASGDIHGYRQGLTDLQLDDLQLASVKGNFIVDEDESFIGTVMRLVFEQIETMPFIVESDSTRIISTFRDSAVGALEYKKATITGNKAEEDRMSRIIRKFNNSKIELLRRRIVMRFATREERLYVDFDFFERENSRILYGIHISTNKESYGSDSFTVRCIHDIDDFCKYIMLDKERHGKYRQQSVYYSEILNLKEFLYQVWLQGEIKNESITFNQFYKEV